MNNSFSRVNHFINQLKFLQGKIEPENGSYIIDLIKSNYRVDLKTDLINVLKSLGEQKYIEHVEWIKKQFGLKYNQLDISQDDFEKLIEEFKQIFNSNREIIRKLPNLFVIYKLLNKLEIKHEFNFYILEATENFNHYECLWVQINQNSMSDTLTIANI